jgi:PAS domain S-box-containing protein
LRGESFIVSDAGLQQQVHHLSAVNRHLRVLVDQIAEGALVVETLPAAGLGPQIMFVNRGICRMTGRRPEELLGRPLADVFDSARLGEFLALLPRVAQVGRAAVTRAQLVTVSGAERPCRWTVSAVRDTDDRLLNFIVTVADESPTASTVAAPLRQEEPEEDFLHQMARLENLEVIASGIAHDFRNQLTAVMLNISNAGAQPRGVDAYREFLERASGSARQAKELADQLMEFARGGTPVTGLADPGHLLSECAHLTLSGSNCRHHLEITPDLWLTRIDKTRIKQVIHNLLINASQAMPEGGHILAAAKNVMLSEDEIAGLPAGPYVAISVHDRGTGIPAAVLPNIFKRNFTTKKTGNGLGLASSWHIVRSHEGMITVSSTPGMGTEFIVHLPACPAEKLERPAPPTMVEAPPSAGFGSVLIVDDQHVVRAAVRSSLDALGYEAEEAATGEEAVDRYRRRFLEGRPFQLVLMDLTLPGGHSGDDAMREIRQLDPGARVIASSGAIEAGMHGDLLRLGYISALPKPFDLQKLSQALSEAAAASLPA